MNTEKYIPAYATAVISVCEEVIEHIMEPTFKKMKRDELIIVIENICNNKYYKDEMMILVLMHFYAVKNIIQHI